MESKPPSLGRRLKIGATFTTATKRMTKNRHGQTKWNKDKTGPLITYKVLRPGELRTFTKGGRRYLCLVEWLQEMRTGIYNENGPRWWQFFYKVKVIKF